MALYHDSYPYFLYHHVISITDDLYLSFVLHIINMISIGENFNSAAPEAVHFKIEYRGYAYHITCYSSHEYK